MVVRLEVSAQVIYQDGESGNAFLLFFCRLPLFYLNSSGICAHPQLFRIFFKKKFFLQKLAKTNT